MQPQFRKQGLIQLRIRITRRQQFIAIKNRIRAGEKTRRIAAVVKFMSARQKPTLTGFQHNP